MIRAGIAWGVVAFALFISIYQIASAGGSFVHAQSTQLAWTQAPSVGGPVDLSSVFMVDQNTAWVSGGDDENSYAAK